MNTFFFFFDKCFTNVCFMFSYMYLVFILLGPQLNALGGLKSFYALGGPISLGDLTLLGRPVKKVLFINYI